jgi:hypothetical protein
VYYVTCNHDKVRDAVEYIGKRYIPPAVYVSITKPSATFPRVPTASDHDPHSWLMRYPEEWTLSPMFNMFRCTKTFETPERTGFVVTHENRGELFKLDIPAPGVALTSVMYTPNFKYAGSAGGIGMMGPEVGMFPYSYSLQRIKGFLLKCRSMMSVGEKVKKSTLDAVSLVENYDNPPWIITEAIHAHTGRGEVRSSSVLDKIQVGEIFSKIIGSSVCAYPLFASVQHAIGKPKCEYREFRDVIMRGTWKDPNSEYHFMFDDHVVSHVIKQGPVSGRWFPVVESYEGDVTSSEWRNIMVVPSGLCEDICVSLHEIYTRIPRIPVLYPDADGRGGDTVGLIKPTPEDDTDVSAYSVVREHGEYVEGSMVYTVTGKILMDYNLTYPSVSILSGTMRFGERTIIPRPPLFPISFVGQRFIFTGGAHIPDKYVYEAGVEWDSRAGRGVAGTGGREGSSSTWAHARRGGASARRRDPGTGSSGIYPSRTHPGSHGRPSPVPTDAGTGSAAAAAGIDVSAGAGDRQENFWGVYDE